MLRTAQKAVSKKAGKGKSVSSRLKKCKWEIQLSKTRAWHAEAHKVANLLEFSVSDEASETTLPSQHKESSIQDSSVLSHPHSLHTSEQSTHIDLRSIFERSTMERRSQRNEQIAQMFGKTLMAQQQPLSKLSLESQNIWHRIELLKEQRRLGEMDWTEQWDLCVKHERRWKNGSVHGSDHQIEAALRRYCELRSRIDEFPPELQAKILEYGRESCHEYGMTADSIARQLEYETKNIEESREEILQTVQTMQRMEQARDGKSSSNHSKSSSSSSSSSSSVSIDELIHEFSMNTKAALSECNDRTRARSTRMHTLGPKIVASLDPYRVSLIAVRMVLDLFNDASTRSARSELDTPFDAVYDSVGVGDRFEEGCENILSGADSEHSSEQSISSMNSTLVFTTLLSTLGRALEEDSFLTQRVLAQKTTENFWLQRKLASYNTGRPGSLMSSSSTESEATESRAHGDSNEWNEEDNEEGHSGKSMSVDTEHKKPRKAFLDSATRMELCRTLGLRLGDKWDEKTRIQVASVVFECMRQSCLFEGSPVFTLQRINQGGRSLNLVRIKNLAFLSLLRHQPRYRSPKEIRPVSRPMVCPPRPWRNASEGPFFFYNESLMRIEDSKYQLRPLRKNCDHLQREESRLCTEQSQIDKRGSPQELNLGYLMGCLNSIQATPWVLNTPVINMIRWIFEEKGGGIAKIPSANDIAIPDPSERTTETDRDWKYKVDSAHKLNRELHSLRCDLQLRLKLADELAEEPVIYFPVNLDFRGRVYPVPPHINLIGSDLVRSMCRFAEKKPLGERGWFWLRVNLANKFGFDKVHNSERCKWTDERMEKVLECAEDPRNHLWWLNEATDPFQALSTMIEIRDALESGDPESFESGLPVGQDGSCNGLQHYAAMLKDLKMAEYVNVAARDKVGDVYSAVKDKVVGMVAEDALNESHPMHRYAVILNGHITRKLLKQTVMTSVYGVTEYGAKGQIRKWLREMGLQLPSPIEESEMACASYLAKYTINAIGQTNTPAWLSMLWLKTCSQKISDKGHRVSWVTPLGLPCTQAYASGEEIVALPMGTSVTLSKTDGKIRTFKQVNAFPPNFVHSLDSTHCLMTAKRCTDEYGLRFASIHDSFWTHACDVDTMNTVLREEFVRLHNQPLLWKLYQSFVAQYPEIDFEPPPKVSDFDLREVFDSKFFFS